MWLWGDLAVCDCSFWKNKATNSVNKHLDQMRDTTLTDTSLKPLIKRGIAVIKRGRKWYTTDFTIQFSYPKPLPVSDVWVEIDCGEIPVTLALTHRYTYIKITLLLANNTYYHGWTEHCIPLCKSCISLLFQVYGYER